MAQPGEVLRNPTTGQWLVFRRTSAQTSGRLLEVEVHYEPREERPADRSAREQEHQVEILSGALRAVLDGRAQRLTAGEVLVVPSGSSFAIWNACGAPARAVWHTYPVLDAEASLEATWQAL